MNIHVNTIGENQYTQFSFVLHYYTGKHVVLIGTPLLNRYIYIALIGTPLLQRYTHSSNLYSIIAQINIQFSFVLHYCTDTRSANQHSIIIQILYTLCSYSIITHPHVQLEESQIVNRAVDGSSPSCAKNAKKPSASF